MKTRLLASLCLVATGALAPTAYGADPDPKLKQAETLFREGVALAQEGERTGDMRKREQAHAKLLASYGFAKRPNTLFAMALNERNLARNVDAIRHFRTLLREHKASAEPTVLKNTQANVNELEPQVAVLTVEAPSGAEILVDDVPYEERAPLTNPIDVAPGKHVLAARLDDKRSSVESTFKAGEKTSVRIPEFVAAPTKPIPSTDVDIERGRTPTTPTPTPSSARLWTLVGTGAAAGISAGIGVYFAVKAGSARSRIDDLSAANPADSCPPTVSSPVCTEWRDASSDRVTSINVARGAFVTAGVAAAGFAAVLLFWPSSSSVSRAWIAPKVGTHEGSLQMGGSF